MLKQAMIIFTRVPVPGKVKTRLGGRLSQAECAAVQEAMIADLFHKLGPLSRETCDVFVCYSDEQDPTSFLEAVPKAFESFPQIGQMIGQRMNHAFQTLYRRGYQQVVLIGSDIPGVTPQGMRTALNQLNSHDLVIGPSVDGGYYLIGANQQDLGFLFLEKNFPWGEGSVYQKTLAKLSQETKSVSHVEVLGDIDYHRDLVRYTESELPDNHRLNRWLYHHQACLNS